jgi:hypothetical protein
MICYICLDQLIFNARNRRTVKKYDLGRNGKSIIKRLYLLERRREPELNWSLSRILLGF